MQIAIFVTLAAVVVGLIFVLRARTRRATPEETARARKELAAWITHHRIPLGLLLGGAVMTVLGLFMFVHALVSSTVPLDLASIERGDPPPGSFVRVSGEPSPELALLTTPRAGEDIYYTPLRSRLEQPVALLVIGRAPMGRTGPFEGLLMTDMPFGMQSQLKETGARIAPTVYVLTLGETPEARRPVGLVIFAVGAVLAGVGGFLVRRSLRKRRAAR